MDDLILKTKVSDIHNVENLLLPDKLKESGAPKLIFFSIFILSFIVFLIFIWAVFTEIDEVTTGDGEILPITKLTPIQHLEGGIVYKVYVKDGDFVEAGDKLLKLEQENFKSDLERLKKKQNSIQINMLTLHAVIYNQEINNESIIDSLSYKEVSDLSLVKMQIFNALAFFQEQVKQQQYNQEQLSKRILQENRNLENLKNQLLHFNERKNILEDQVEIYMALSKKKATSRINLLDAQDRLEEVISELLEVSREEIVTESTILDLENQLKTLKFDEKQQMLKELNDLTANLLEVREEIVKIQDRVDRLLITAPIDGIVTGLTLDPGNVIMPAEELFEIVPTDVQLIAQIDISTTDIGHIKVGNKVQIKVETYDFATYGQITGEVHYISPSTFIRKDNIPYYQSIIFLDKNYLGNDPNTNLIFPGMTVSADIKTNQRSLLKYFFKPINRTFDEAFKER